VETVPSLYPYVRPQAEYERSLRLLRWIKEIDAGIYSKSGIMAGLGESRSEVYGVFADLRQAGCEFLSIGQYLQPSAKNVEVKEYILPEAFEQYRREALDRGFLYVKSTPYTRSSYCAHEYMSTGEIR